MLTISNVFTILRLLCLCGNRKYPGNFQNKSVSSSFKWMPNYILLLAKLKGEGRPFWRLQEGGGAALWDNLPEHLFVIKDEKVCPFVKFEIILPLLCCLLDTPYKQALQGMDFYNRFVDRFQDLPKV